MSVAKKILEIMKDVEGVVKDKRNDFHGYKYASDEAVVRSIREAMIKHGLVAIPNQKSCTKEGDITTIGIEYVLMDVDTDEKVTVGVYGQGQDKGDKGSYKAATGAEKYFLLKTFLIPTSDDPEAFDDKTPEPYRPALKSNPPGPREEVAEDVGDAQEPPLEEVEVAPGPKHWPHPAEPEPKKPGCISEKQAKRLFAIAKSVGLSSKGLKDFINEKINSEHLMDIPWKRYDAIVNEVQAMGK